MGNSCLRGWTRLWVKGSPFFYQPFVYYLYKYNFKKRREIHAIFNLLEYKLNIHLFLIKLLGFNYFKLSAYLECQGNQIKPKMELLMLSSTSAKQNLPKFLLLALPEKEGVSQLNSSHKLPDLTSCKRSKPALTN